MEAIPVHGRCESDNIIPVRKTTLWRLGWAGGGGGGPGLDLGRPRGKGFAKMQVLSDVEVLVKS